MARLLVVVLACVTIFSQGIAAQAQIKWYKFDKGFINGTFPADSAFGFVRASASSPPKQVHTVGCGGHRQCGGCARNLRVFYVWIPETSARSLVHE